MSNRYEIIINQDEQTIFSLVFNKEIDLDFLIEIINKIKSK